MSLKTTAYFTTASLSVIGDLGQRERSGRMNSIITRYGEIARQSVPELSAGEWSVICDALRGVWQRATGKSTDPAPHINMEIAASGLGEKWGIDVDALALRVKQMPLASQCAIIEVVTRFWQSPRLEELDPAELLREAGARVKS